MCHAVATTSIGLNTSADSSACSALHERPLSATTVDTAAADESSPSGQLETPHNAHIGGWSHRAAGRHRARVGSAEDVRSVLVLLFP